MNRPEARALIETLAEQARSETGSGEAGEPDADELLAYLRGELTADDEERLSRRLVADPAAARALLDLAELETAAGAADETLLADPEVRDGWRDLEARLPRAPGPPVRRGWLPAWLMPALAGLLLFATAGLGVRVAQLERTLDAPAALVAGYLPEGERGGGEETVFRLPRGASLQLVVPLSLDLGESCGELTAAIDGPGGERWTVAGLTSDTAAQVTLSLPHPAAGAYRLRVDGCEPRRQLAAAGFLVASAREGDGGG